MGTALAARRPANFLGDLEVACVMRSRLALRSGEPAIGKTGRSLGASRSLLLDVLVCVTPFISVLGVQLLS